MGNSMKQSMIPMTSGRVAAAAYRWGRFVFRATGPARDQASAHAIAAIDDASTRTLWMRERGEREGVDVTRRLCKALGHL